MGGRYENNPLCTRRWFSPLYLLGLFKNMFSLYLLS